MQPKVNTHDFLSFFDENLDISRQKVMFAKTSKIFSQYWKPLCATGSKTEFFHKGITLEMHFSAF